MAGDNRLVTEQFLASNFTPDPGITPGSNNLLNMDCSQVQNRYQVNIAGITSTGTRCPSQNQLSSSAVSEVIVVAVGDGIYSIGYSTTGGVDFSGVRYDAVGSVYTGRGVIYASYLGLWIVVGDATFGSSGTISTSTDGINWTSRGKTVFTTSANAVATNGSIVVAVGQGSNTIGYSYDGVNWYGAGSSVFTSAGYGVHWASSLGMFVAFGTGGNTIAYSTNGTSWTGLGSSIFTTDGRSGWWNGSLFVAVGNGTNAIATSTNGTSWTGRGQTSLFSTFTSGVCYNGSLWIAGGNDWNMGGANGYATSSDGINWTGGGTSPLSIVRGLTYSNYLGKALAAGFMSSDSIYSSTNGTSWSEMGVPVGVLFNGYGGYWVACKYA